MYRKTGLLFCSLLLLLAACNKDTLPPALPAGSISIRGVSDADTLITPLPVLKDSVIVIGLMAKLTGNTSSADHWVSFGVDTTKINEYHTQYGDAVLLPPDSYFFYKPLCRIAAGSTLSDSAQINIVQETKLKGYTTYVLPVTIQSVDGITDGAAGSEVLYLVFKTGKPAFISKDGWAIAGSSSHFNLFIPDNLLDDDDLNTYWTSNITLPMPQWIEINFNSEVTFSAVNYYLPTLLQYPALGGYPTSIQIETSIDGTNWENKGIFSGDINDNKQTINIGVTVAGYLRFTVLSVVPYAGTYDCTFISGIGLVP